MKIQLGCQTTGFNILRFTHQFCCESVVVSYFSLEKHITKPVHKAVFCYKIHSKWEKTV